MVNIIRITSQADPRATVEPPSTWLVWRTVICIITIRSAEGSSIQNIAWISRIQKYVTSITGITSYGKGVLSGFWSYREAVVFGREPQPDSWHDLHPEFAPCTCHLMHLFQSKPEIAVVHSISVLICCPATIEKGRKINPLENDDPVIDRKNCLKRIVWKRYADVCVWRDVSFNESTSLIIK